MKKGDIFVFIFIGLIIGGSLWGAFILKQSHGEKHVIIEVKGKVMYDIPMDQMKSGQQIRVNTGKGGYNIVEMKNGAVDVREANCPDQICVKWGSIRNTGETIVCLPHQMSVKIIGGSKKQEIDELAS